MFDIKTLIGKKIKTIAYRKQEEYDDEPFLDIEFTDGTKVTVVATYGEYTGKSADEYPRFVVVKLREDK
jgi:hypothetical protein